MVDPAYQLPDDDKPTIRPDLRALEGGSQTTEPRRGHLSSVDGSEPQSPEALRQAEESSNLYNPDGDKSSVIGKSESQSDRMNRLENDAKEVAEGTTPGRAAKSAFNLVVGHKRRLKIWAFVGFLSIIGAIIGATITSGPLQLIHLSQLLQVPLYHQEFAAESRLNKLIRFANTGDVGETRVGRLGSKSFAKFTQDLTDEGVTIERDGLNGQMKGLTIDPEENSKYGGLKEQDAIKQIAADNGLDADKVTFGDGNYHVDVTGTSLDTKSSIIGGLVDEQGLGKIASFMRARNVTTFLDIPSALHPLQRASSKLDEKISSGLDSIGAKQKFTEQRDALIEKLPDGASEKITAIKGQITDADAIGAKALTVTAAICATKDIAADIPVINRDAVMVPAMASAVDGMSLGSQVQSNQDFTTGQLGAVETGFKDPKDGTTIFDGAAMKALASETGGVPVDPTIKSSFSPSSTPQSIVDFLNSVGANYYCGGVGGVLSSVGGFALLATGAGGVVEKVVSTAVSYVAIKAVTQEIPKLLADKPISGTPHQGAYGGNVDAFAAREYANTTVRSEGGDVLSDSQVAVLDQESAAAQKQAFQSESVADRVFNVKDEHSLASHFIDSEGGNVAQNVASMFGSLLHFGNLLHNLSSIFTPHSFAASPAYDWGFPEYGFSQQDLDNPAVNDPYANATAVAQLLDSSSGQNYITQAQNCFGTTIQKDSQGDWEAVPSGDVNTQATDYPGTSVCDNHSDPNWLKVRFFILDTGLMDGYSCYSLNDDESCQNSGFRNATDSSSGSGGDSSASGPVEQGTPAQLAAKVLSYRASGKYTCDSTGDCADLQAVANGQPLAHGEGCVASTLDPRIMQTMLYLIEVGKYQIGTTAICSDHSFDGVDGHSGGKAFDIGSINGVAINQATAQSKTNVISVDKFLNNVPDSIKLNQQISYGYGKQYDADVAAYQQYNGALCGSSCVSIYTPKTESEHENHIHVGF